MNRIVERFFEYIRIDSETRNEKEISEYLKIQLEELGFNVFIDNAGDSCGSNTGNVIGYLKGNKTNSDSIMFSSHMDTVKPGINIIPIVDDGIIRSSTGTILGADDKAGIASIIEAVARIKKDGISHPDIEVIFTICEEGGLYGSKNVDFSKIKSKMGIVIDSSGDVGGIVTKAPSQSKIKATIMGITAHAGLHPEKGVSAIMVMAEAIHNMKLLRIDDETTANIGTISGGVATNIVAESCEVLIECRSLDSDKLNKYTKHIEQCVENAATKNGVTASIDTNILYPPFNLNKNEKVVNIVSDAMDKCGITAFIRSTGGGSDANIYNSKGIKTVNLNCGSKNVHTVDESIRVDQLENLCDVVYSIIKGQ